MYPIWDFWFEKKHLATLIRSQSAVSFMRPF
jgi:hypothetical protein